MHQRAITTFFLLCYCHISFSTSAMAESSSRLERAFDAFVARHWQATVDETVKAVYYQKEAAFWDKHLWVRDTAQSVEARHYTHAADMHLLAAKCCIDETTQRTHLFAFARYSCDALMAKFYGDYDWETIPQSTEFTLLPKDFEAEDAEKIIVSDSILSRHTDDTTDIAVYVASIKKNLQELQFEQLAENYFLWEHVYRKIYWQGNEQVRDWAFEQMRALENLWLPLAGNYMVEKCQQLIWESRAMAKRKSNYARTKQLLRRAEQLESLFVALNKAELTPHGLDEKSPLGSITEGKEDA